jgi:hypothetical protein
MPRQGSPVHVQGWNYHMPADITKIIDAANSILKPAGFRHRNKRNWYWINDEVTQKLHLEKSTYDNKNWFDCFMSINRMDANNIPEFGITLSVDHLLKNKEEFAHALDQDELSLQDPERVSEIRQGFELYILPTLQILRTESEIVNFYRTKKSRMEFFMNAKTAEFLGLWDFYETENRETEKRQAAYVVNAAQKLKTVSDQDTGNRK